MEQQHSVWLGSLRKPVRAAMIGFSGLTIALSIYLIFNSSIGMHEMIRPQGKPIVIVTLISFALALLFASLYLSDDRGLIEPERTGPFDILSLVCSRLAMLSIAIVVIVMFYEVVSRYAFNAPTMWANELSLWIAAFLFMLAGLYAMQQRSHIRIYVIYDIMPRWMQKASDCMSVFLIWVFTACLIYGGYNDAVRRMLRMETFGTAWDPPLPGTVKPMILIVILLVAIQALSNLIADWNKAPEHHSPADEIDEHEIELIRRTLEQDKK
ncbi:TRAP transporter small permease subunit [Maliponia aquimaris]|uniref:TRAP transporter small permease protein n=1 Tax=Maliponia aquimaris TaxID=1673631 RepID=A0A238KHQ0_9RHOB|nr:TRAP transporter small permease [Maliponia aquimaris]SMX41616.1 Tripartite ATP-independent periplasmic transporters, DctQ component [Maliponia aquimaris]